MPVAFITSVITGEVLSRQEYNFHFKRLHWVSRLERNGEEGASREDKERINETNWETVAVVQVLKQVWKTQLQRILTGFHH